MAVARLLLVMLATLLLLGDGIALRHARAFPHPSAAILLGLVLGEIGLIASWAACARRSWMVRGAIAWASAALAAWPLSVYSGPSWRAWAGLLLVYAAVVVIAWKLTLAAGYRWNWKATEADEASALRPHQCSLAWIMKGLTACSVALGLLSWLALPTLQPWAALASVVMLALCVAPTISTLTLETRRWWLRGVPMLLAPLLAALFVLTNRGASTALLALAVGVQVLVTLLAAMVLSAAGVTLVPVTASTGEPAPGPSLRPADAL